MKKLLSICFMFLALGSSQMFAAGKINNDIQFSEPIGLEIDKVAFDENSLTGVYDDAGNLIANYSRFDNGNSKIKSIKVYDSNKEHIYTISAIDTDNAIYILDKDGKRGKIQVSATIKKMKIEITTEVKFFDKPYDLAYFTDVSFSGASKIYIVTYESKPVIKESNLYSTSDGFKREIIVNKSYLNDNKNECVVWVLALFAMDEMESASNRATSGTTL